MRMTRCGCRFLIRRSIGIDTKSVQLADIEDAILRQGRLGHYNLIPLGVGRPAGDALFFGKVAAILENSNCSPFCIKLTRIELSLASDLKQVSRQPNTYRGTAVLHQGNRFWVSVWVAASSRNKAREAIRRSMAVLEHIEPVSSSDKLSRSVCQRSSKGPELGRVGIVV